jgi:hypothetical protein
MNCGRVSNQLSAYIDRELTGVEMLQFRRHLNECDRCRSEHEALCRMKMMLGRLRSVEPPPAFVGETVRRFGAAGSPTGGAAASGKRAPWFLVAARLFPAPGDGGSPFHSRRTGSPGASWIAQRLLSIIRWQPLTLGLTTALLAAALIFSSMVLLRPRHADTLVASTPAQVISGEDQDSLDPPQYFDGTEGDATLHNVLRDRLPHGQTALPWVPVSFQGETSWTFR